MNEALTGWGWRVQQKVELSRMRAHYTRVSAHSAIRAQDAGAAELDDRLAVQVSGGGTNAMHTRQVLVNNTLPPQDTPRLVGVEDS